MLYLQIDTMNTQQMNLQLSLALVNAKANSSIKELKKLVTKVVETGAFIGLKLRNRTALDATRDINDYALSYEHCTIDVQLIKNKNSGLKTIQNFRLH